MYDFSRCKLCGQDVAAEKFKLPQMIIYACGNCDFHYIDALDTYPDDQPEPQLTNNARKYIEKQLPLNAIQLRKNLAFIKQHLELNGLQCLDVGCGAGQFSTFLQEEGAEPQGIEPQQIFREYTKEKFQLDFRRELIDELYWQDGFAGHFDLVTLWDTLEHVNFPADTLKSAIRLLKPGGWLFLDTPSRDSFFYKASEWSYRLSGGSKAALLKRFYSPKPYRHKQIFTALQLARLVGDCGYSELTYSSSHNPRKKLVVGCRKVTE